MPLPLALVAGTALRMGGTRLASGAVASGGSGAGGQAMRFGGMALQASARRPQHEDPVPPQAQTPEPTFASQHKGSLAAAMGVATIRATAAPSMGEHANAAFRSVMQPGQFG